MNAKMLRATSIESYKETEGVIKLVIRVFFWNSATLSVKAIVTGVI